MDIHSRVQYQKMVYDVKEGDDVVVDFNPIQMSITGKDNIMINADDTHTLDNTKASSLSSPCPMLYPRN